MQSKRLNLRLEIYFSLTKRQQRLFNEKSYWQFMENLGLTELSKITKNKRILGLYRELLQTFKLKAV